MPAKSHISQQSAFVAELAATISLLQFLPAAKLQPQPSGIIPVVHCWYALLVCIVGITPVVHGIATNAANAHAVAVNPPIDDLAMPHPAVATLGTPLRQNLPMRSTPHAGCAPLSHNCPNICYTCAFCLPSAYDFPFPIQQCSSFSPPALSCCAYCCSSMHSTCYCFATSCTPSSLPQLMQELHCHFPLQITFNIMAAAYRQCLHSTLTDSSSAPQASVQHVINTPHSEQLTDLIYLVGALLRLTVTGGCWRG